MKKLEMEAIESSPAKNEPRQTDEVYHAQATRKPRKSTRRPAYASVRQQAADNKQQNGVSSHQSEMSNFADINI